MANKVAPEAPGISTVQTVLGMTLPEHPGTDLQVQLFSCLMLTQHHGARLSSNSLNPAVSCMESETQGRSPAPVTALDGRRKPKETAFFSVAG